MPSSRLTRLSENQRVEYGILKERFRKGMQGFWDGVQALQIIRGERLYREEYDSFEEFCQTDLNLSRDYAYMLMKAGEVYANLMLEMPTIVGILPESEAQLRPIAKANLAPEEQREAWAEAVAAAGGKPTAAVVKAVVDRRSRSDLAANQPAIVCNPNHALFGQPVTVKAIKGDIVTIATSTGETHLLKPELQAISLEDQLKAFVRRVLGLNVLPEVLQLEGRSLLGEES
ncbi:MAG: hypothetical protein KME27_10670 [Lyngbya sp. HA4199-MV5]|jgi:hypothetical protein|nr:hypothetical protein [Lyngbya sp. HA4199-MV5]